MKNIFVSSTFRDFQWERDMLHKQVLSKLNYHARKYGESVGFCDLRWGVDTSSDKDEKESSQTVLDVCLNEIDRSRPYMIVLLGERYGYIPDKGILEENIKRKNLQLEDLEISVTALEIEYGGLNKAEDRKDTFFYFREIEGMDLPLEFLSESLLYKQKLQNIKERIKNLAGDNVRYYTVKWENGELVGFDIFTQMVFEDLKTLLEPKWIELDNMHKYAKDMQSQWTYLEEKAKVFKAHQSFLEEITQLLEQGQPAPVVIKGKEGSGKSTLFAKVCFAMQEKGFTVLPFAGGNTAISTNAFEIMQSLIWQLEMLAQTSHVEDNPEILEADMHDNGDIIEKYRERLAWLCGILKDNGQRILLAVDALDQLQMNQLRDELKFLPNELSQNIQVLCTCLENFTLPYNRVCVPMPVLSDEDKKLAIDSILLGMGKQLSASVKDILSSKTNADTPLALYLFLIRLTAMERTDYQKIHDSGDGIEKISEYQINIIEHMPQKLQDIMSELLAIVGRRLDTVSIKRIAKYLAVSRNGLRTTDLELLLQADGLNFNSLKFAQFVGFFNELFLIRLDQRWDFLHKSLRAGIVAEYNENELSQANQKIFEALKSLDVEDNIRIEEIIYHAILASENEFVADYICSALSLPLSRANDMRKATVRDMLFCSVEDGGAFVESFLASLDMTHFDKCYAILSFMQFDFFPAFGYSLKENQLKMRLAKVQLATVLRFSEKHDTEQVKTLLSYCFALMGDCHNIKSDEQVSKQAGYYYKNSLDIRAKLLEENASVENMKLVLESYDTLSYYFNGLDVVEEIESKGFAEKALGMAKMIDERLDSEESKSHLCKAYYNLGSNGKWHANDIDSIAKGVAIARGMYSKNPSDDNLRLLQEGFGTLAEITKLLHKSSPNTNRKIMYYFRESYELCKKIVQKNPTVPNLRKFAKLHELVAVSYVEFFGYLGTACDYLSDECKILKNIAKTLNDYTSLMDLARCYTLIGRVYELDDVIDEALKFHEKAWDIFASLENTASSYSFYMAFRDVNTSIMRLHNVRESDNKYSKKELDLCTKIVMLEGMDYSDNLNFHEVLDGRVLENHQIEEYIKLCQDRAIKYLKMQDTQYDEDKIDDSESIKISLALINEYEFILDALHVLGDVDSINSSNLYGETIISEYQKIFSLTDDVIYHAKLSETCFKIASSYYTLQDTHPSQRELYMQYAKNYQKRALLEYEKEIQREPDNQKYFRLAEKYFEMGNFCIKILDKDRLVEQQNIDAHHFTMDIEEAKQNYKELFLHNFTNRMNPEKSDFETAVLYYQKAISVYKYLAFFKEFEQKSNQQIERCYDKLAYIYINSPKIMDLDVHAMYKKLSSEKSRENMTYIYEELEQTEQEKLELEQECANDDSDVEEDLVLKILLSCEDGRMYDEDEVLECTDMLKKKLSDMQEHFDKNKTLEALQDYKDISMQLVELYTNLGGLDFFLQAINCTDMLLGNLLEAQEIECFDLREYVFDLCDIVNQLDFLGYADEYYDFFLIEYMLLMEHLEVLAVRSNNAFFIYFVAKEYLQIACDTSLDDDLMKTECVKKQVERAYNLLLAIKDDPDFGDYAVADLEICKDIMEK